MYLCMCTDDAKLPTKLSRPRQDQKSQEKSEGVAGTGREELRKRVHTLVLATAVTRPRLLSPIAFHFIIRFNVYIVTHQDEIKA